MEVLQSIAVQNGSAFNVELADVHDSSEEEAAKGSVQYHRLEEGDPGEYDPDMLASHDQKRPDMPTGIRRTVQDYLDRLSILLGPDLRKTTALVWTLWFTVSAAYT